MAEILKPQGFTERERAHLVELARRERIRQIEAESLEKIREHNLLARLEEY